TESNVVHELINSVLRHIESSQANILLVDEYAQKVNMAEDSRSELIMDEFMRIFLSIAGKDKIMSDDTVKNYSTKSPVHSLVILFCYIKLFYFTDGMAISYLSFFISRRSKSNERTDEALRCNSSATSLGSNGCDIIYYSHCRGGSILWHCIVR